MTPIRFDALAAATRPAPPPSRALDRANPTVRIAWLIARFVRHERIRFDAYEQRFGRSIRSFHRDMAALRDAGLYLDSERSGEYRMLCFNADREAA